jgi:UDP-glucose 4-epimerase
MKVLVVGAAGYIGSQMGKLLLDGGHDVTTFDNLSSGHADAVSGGAFVKGDLEYSGRRPGDAPRLVADSGLARRTLGWSPRYPALDTIVEHARKFERGRKV